MTEEVEEAGAEDHEADDAPHADGGEISAESGDAEAPIPGAEDLIKARVSATTLLQIVGVTRVVCVDDDFAGDVDDLKDACARLADAEIVVSCLNDVAFGAPPEVWRVQLDEAWAALPATDRRVALADAREKAGLLDSEGQLNAGALWSVLDEPIEFIALTPDDWQAQSDALVAASSENPTLVLFDKELGDGVDGLKLAVDLYARDPTGQIWAGLFTHTVTVANEPQEWVQMSAQPGVVAERFILLSKEHLGPDPVTFPQALKVALMTRPAAVLRHSVTDAVTAQVAVALRELDALSPSEFERLVFGLPRDEGQWEVDMLLRLFDAFLRSEVRQALHSRSDVQEATTILRELAEAATLPIVGTAEAQRIYRRELYEEATYLNAVHLPLELGDLFRTGAGKKYVTVGQPCDLMVRPDGRRAPDLAFANLLLVVDEDPNKQPAAEPDAGALPGSVRPLVPAFELPAFSSGASAWVRLDRAYLVPIEALDFCVFDLDGRSIAPRSGSEPAWIVPAWARRFDILANQAVKLRNRLMKLPNKDVKGRVADASFGRRAGSAAALAMDDDHWVSFDIERIARLCNPYSRALLARYAAHVSRDGFEPRMI